MNELPHQPLYDQLRDTKEATHNIERCYPTRDRKARGRFTVNALMRVHDEDGLSVRLALQGENEREWRKAMKSKLQTLKENQNWKEVERPQHATVLQAKLVLKRKRDGAGKIQKYKVRIEVCRNVKVKNNENTFSPVSDFAVIRLTMYLAVQKEWFCQNFDFQTHFQMVHW